MSDIAAHRQSLTPGAEVVLFVLNLGPLGVQEVMYFCADFGVSFGGVPYSHVPVKLEGLERTATGETVAPTFTLPNTSKFSSALVLQYEDLVGAELTRFTTYEKYLDGRPGADPEAIEVMDVFVVEQKKNINKIYGEWELRALGDTGDRFLPGRQANKNVCSFTYRTWDPVTQQFVRAKRKPCPYVNTQHLFTKDNQPTNDPAQDRCDYFVGGGCMTRTPGWPGGVLGFGGFPGMNRYRVG